MYQGFNWTILFIFLFWNLVKIELCAYKIHLMNTSLLLSVI